MAQQDNVGQLVVIGASSGGLEALSSLLSSLPASLPAAVVIAQHLSPTRTSHLEEIFARRTPLPVHTVTERATLKAGVVYVVPPNRHVELAGHELHLIPDHGGPHPSIDLLLTSAARVFGENLIAIILSGQGSDGAVGARAVKAAGGVVMIQDPASAAFPSMPRSLAPTVVDVAAPVERLGALLQALLREGDHSESLEATPSLPAFLEHVRQRQGLDFTSYRTPTILRRLHRRMVATGANSLSEYMQYMDANPEEYQQLTQAFLIKVTEFFRDGELYNHLRDVLLPELIATARLQQRGLRCWSAGCATGEEPYSLAILIAELFGDALEQANVRIFATDLDAEAVAFARRGVYPAGALAALPPDLVSRYFTRQDDDFVVKKRVRSLIVFGQQDLGQRAPFPDIDLVLCRNVLIYFSADLQRRTLQLFAFALRDGGYLALGKAETTRPLAQYFEEQDRQLKVYRRRGGRIMFPPAQIRRATSAPAPIRAGARAEPRLRLLADLEQGRGGAGPDVFAELSIGVVILDRRYDIQSINRAARQLFGIHGAAIGEDFLHLVQNMRPSLLREPIDAALRGEEAHPQDELTAIDDTVNETRYIRLLCQPHRRSEAGVESVLLQALDITREVAQRHALEQEMARAALAQGDASTEATQREAALEATLAAQEAQLRDMTVANLRLREANIALVSANNDLRGLSEEYLISSEEAQAASEEVETLNEELQASNEELETLNEEMQSTVEELHATNDDLEARSEELEDMARRAELERARLEAILGGLSDAVLVVDAAGRPALANRAYEEFFGAPNTPMQALDSAGNPVPPEELPAARAARGEAFSMECAVQNAAGERRWFEARGQTINSEGQRQGVVVLRDVTERSLRRLQEEFLALASHELSTPLTVIRGYLQMLVRALDRDPKRARECAEIAINQVEQLTIIARDLVDVARLQGGQLRIAQQPVDLAAVVRQVADLAPTLADRPPVRLTAPDGPLLVRGDAGRLQQVLLNLLTNALRYAPASKRVDLRLQRRDGQAEFEVQDYGPGIPADQLPAIFSRFVQGAHASRSGLGLGLYIAREIVTLHGGSIRVDSAVGEGSTFTVTLPLLAEDADQGPADVPGDPPVAAQR